MPGTITTAGSCKPPRSAAAKAQRQVRLAVRMSCQTGKRLDNDLRSCHRLAAVFQERERLAQELAGIYVAAFGHLNLSQDAQCVRCKANAWKAAGSGTRTPGHVQLPESPSASAASASAFSAIADDPGVADLAGQVQGLLALGAANA